MSSRCTDNLICMISGGCTLSKAHKSTSMNEMSDQSKGEHARTRTWLWKNDTQLITNDGTEPWHKKERY